MNITNKILKWYDANQRVLPWRDNKDPYRVWISEIMLQQTQVKTVIPYFNRFIEELPNVSVLANVEDDLLNKLWEGLGYYSRARNLKKAAMKVMEEFDGVIPRTREDLESLPGIGPYTSGAIASISFEEKVTAVDGNVLRVFARYLGIHEDIKDIQIKKSIASFVETKLPDERVGDFNQALMEIGAIICVPNGVPKCLECPIRKGCIAFNHSMTSSIPAKRKTISRNVSDITVFIFKYKEEVAIRKRPDSGLLAGLYEYPNVEERVSIEMVQKTYPNAQVLPKKKHVFTHKEWKMTPYLIEVDKKSSDFLWATIDELSEVYPLPTAFKKIEF